MDRYETETAVPTLPVPATGEVASRCGDALVLVRLDGTIGSWDQRAREMFGRIPEEVLGLPFCTLFTAGCRDDVDGLVRAAQSDPLRTLATALDADGVPFAAEITSSRTLGVQNGAAGVVEVVRDVTEARVVAASLLACAGPPDREHAIAALDEALGCWIPYRELTLGVVESNQRYRHPTRGEPAALDALHGHDSRDPGSPIHRVLRAGQAVIVQDTSTGIFSIDEAVAAQGIGSYALIPLACEGCVFGTLNLAFAHPAVVSSRIVRLAAAVADAVGPPLSRTLAFEETARAISRLEQADRHEKQVLALIAHDMRTPITVIAGFARSLREKWDDLQEGERLASLDAILRNGANLSRLVEQDMQFALVESGELPYEMSTFDVGAQVERIVDDFARTADARFALNIARPLPLARGDQQRNTQILGNLLSNAVKFSPSGTLIEIGCCERDAMVHVSVRDHGPGISHGDTKKLFRKFERVTNGHAVPVDGTGLGLYLSRCMVEAQGGRIWVDSRRGAGSTFTYTLPRAAAQWGPGTIPR